MEVYILRHATAETRRPNLSDRKRRLTAPGLEELNAAVRGMKRLKVGPDEILASPYRRAWDTALIAGRALNPAKRPIECTALAPSANVARIWLELKKFPALKAIMLVGHEPLLSEFAGFLLNAPNLTINLKKSGLIRIDLATVQVNRPAGELRWVLTGRHLARLG